MTKIKATSEKDERPEQLLDAKGHEVVSGVVAGGASRARKKRDVLRWGHTHIKPDGSSRGGAHKGARINRSLGSSSPPLSTPDTHPHDKTEPEPITFHNDCTSAPAALNCTAWFFLLPAASTRALSIESHVRAAKPENGTQFKIATSEKENNSSLDPKTASFLERDHLRRIPRCSKCLSDSQLIL